MNGYIPSRKVRNALAVFMDAVRDEPLPGDPAEADGDLGEEYRRASIVLRACAGEAQPSAEPSPERIPSRFDAGLKEVRTVKLDELSGIARAGPEESLADPASPAAEPPPPSLVKDEAPPAPQPSLLAVRHVVTLKNARAGEDYSDCLVLEGAREIRLEDDGGTGLVFDQTDWAFSGIPSGPGDFELKLSGKIDDRPAEITAKLAVIPDPKSLWTSIDSDQSAPFAKPDEDFGLVMGDGLRMIAASKRGRSHAKNGGFREDDFALVSHGAWHIAAVADGAGSARYSRRGSRLAVETVAAELRALIDRHLGAELETLLARLAGRPEYESELQRRLYETLVTAAHKAMGAIEKQAEELGEPPASLSTTLILVIARRFASRWFVAGFSIGDGGAALLGLDAGQVTPLTLPDSGEYAGQTRFLARSEFGSFEEVTKRLRFATPERFTAIALMSDGITDPKLPTDKAFADPVTWAGFWSEDLAKEVDFSAPEEELRTQFLAGLDFWSPGNHDDRTLAVLLPREG